MEDIKLPALARPQVPGHDYSRKEMQDYARATAEAVLQSPEVQALRDALWTCAEHNTLHFGESHNTVIKARAALAAMEKQK